MKECDNIKIHVSSNFILSISLLIMTDTLLLRPSLHCNTPLHFTTLHPTNNITGNRNSSVSTVTVPWAESTKEHRFDSRQQQHILFSSKAFWPSLRPIQTPAQRLSEFLPGGKAARAWSSPLISIYSPLTCLYGARLHHHLSFLKTWVCVRTSVNQFYSTPSIKTITSYPVRYLTFFNTSNLYSTTLLYKYSVTKLFSLS
jgi:hypothetical protein